MVLIGLTVEQAREKGNKIRVTQMDGIDLMVDKKHIPSRRNVHVKDGIIIKETSRG